MPSVIVTKTAGVRCRIKKYILFRQSINGKLMNTLLDYLSSMFGVVINRLELIVRREEFRTYF